MKRRSTMALIATALLILNYYFDGGDFDKILSELPKMLNTVELEDSAEIPEIVITVKEPEKPEVLGHPLIAEEGYAMRRHVLAFGAEWCQPCQNMKPTLSRLQSEGVRIYMFDDAVHKETMTRFGIDTYPTYLIVDGGKIVQKIVGYNPQALTEACR